MLIPNQDKPLFIPKKETYPITRGNVKPTDAGIGSEKNTNPENANKEEEVKLSDSEIEYVSDANTSGNIKSKDIGGQEIVEPPAIQVEHSDPEKENPEKTDNPVTDEVEPPTIPMEQIGSRKGIIQTESILQKRQMDNVQLNPRNSNGTVGSRKGKSRKKWIIL